MVEAIEAPAGFHARFWATGKRYRYQVLCRRERSPLVHLRAWHQPVPLDLAAMRRGAVHLIGEHDFSAFRAAGCDARHPVRTLGAIEIAQDQALVQIDVTGNAFLRNMVRILVGTLVEIGAGERDPDDLPAALASRSRDRVGVTAPAGGLFLVEVFHRTTPRDSPV